jgi:hypothetical protein
VRKIERWELGTLVSLVLAYTLLNALKPLHIDDTAYYFYARQIAAHPLDPYGFTIVWGDAPQAAFEVLAPPGLPYWWSLALRVTSEPWAWKLWLLPLVTCLVLSLHGLFRRFSGDLAVPLTVLTVLSPAFLPSLNLMLDVPAQALGLGSLWLFIRGAERSSPSLVVLSGVAAGCAMQTKYSALLAPAVMLAYAVTHRRLRWWPWSLLAALAVFVSWETFVAQRYGHSHFLHHLANPPEGDSLRYRTTLGLPLLSLIGSLAPSLVVLGLAGLGMRGAVVAAGALAGVLAYLVVAVGPSPGAAFSALGGETLSTAERVFLLLGLVLSAVTGLLALRLSRPGGGKPSSDLTPVGAGAAEWFVCLWLGLEVVGFFAFTPFPAARRVLGLVVALTVLAGRATSWQPPRARRVGAAAALGLGIPVALLVFGLDLREADRQREAVRQAAAWIRGNASAQPGLPASGTVWFTGHWGFQYYAESEGFETLIPEYPISPPPRLRPEPSRLRRGDWLVMPDESIDQPLIRIDPSLRLARRIELDGRWPRLTTVPYFYSGNLAVDRSHRDGLELRIYRVTKDLDSLRTLHDNSSSRSH